MKRNNLIKITVAGFFIFALLLLSNFAAAPGAFGDTGGVSQIGANLEYNEEINLSEILSDPGASSLTAFALSTPSESITLAGGERTNALVFITESGYRGVYVLTDSTIVEYEEDTFRINSVEYTIERTSSSYRITSSQSGSLMIGTQSSGTLILPFAERRAKIVVGSAEVLRTLPAVVIFNSRGTGSSAEAMAEAESDAAERGSVSGTASEDAELGCTDNDGDEEDDGIYMPSHVSVVNAAGSETVTADYCARRGDVTRLYEAVCNSDDTATVRMVVCPEDKVCRGGACIEPDEEISGKYCLDSDIMTEDTAEALTRTVSTKGTTVGFYTATYTGNDGREFGAWSDYCRDRDTLIEYYCSDASRQGLFREIICSEDCVNGVCAIPPYCMDSDGGSFENVKGTVKGVTVGEEYYSHEDSCLDANTVTEYSCDAFDETDAFKTENKACGAGKHCSEGKCVSGEMLCNQCDLLNDFNIKEGTACDGTTPTAWNLKRCPAGQYCSANTCIDEPKATMAQVTTAFEHRKKWAVLLNETLSWIETAKQIAPLTTVVTSGGYADTMEQIATGLSGTQLLLVRREILNPDAFGGRFP